VLFQRSKILLGVSVIGMLLVPAMRMMGQGQAQPPASAAPQKNWKDRAEFDLYDAITKDTTPKTRLEKLQQWTTQYPTTDYNSERKTLFLTTYAALNLPKETTEAAKQLLADDPKSFTALYYIMYFTQLQYAATPSPDVLDQGEKAATTILENINTPPPNVTEEQWKTLRPQVELLAHVNLGFIAMTRKTWDAAEAEFQKSLQMNPNNGQVAYWMGFVIASPKKVERIPTALFYFARAATYEGTGAMDPAGRKKALDYVQRQYKNYHGSNDDFDKLLAVAKNSPTPPADFKIEDASVLAQKKAGDEETWKKTHPQEAMWKGLKETLTGPEGANYFNSSMKDAAVPTLKGKVVKLEPAVKPKMILLALDDGTNSTTADATLKFAVPLAGKVEPGTELTFEGVPESFTPNPLMVVFNVDKDKLHGWTGKNTTAAPPARRRPAKR
jgi:tetratricopeptide (TPR) repeat protein